MRGAALTQEDAEHVARAMAFRSDKPGAPLPFAQMPASSPTRQHVLDIRNGRRPPEWFLVANASYEHYEYAYRYEAIRLSMDAPALVGQGWLKRRLLDEGLPYRRPEGTAHDNASDKVLPLLCVTEEHVRAARAGVRTARGARTLGSRPRRRAALSSRAPNPFEGLADDVLDAILAPELDNWNTRSEFDCVRIDPRTFLDHGAAWRLSLVDRRFRAACQRVAQARCVAIAAQLDGAMIDNVEAATRALFRAEAPSEEARVALSALTHRLERWVAVLLPRAWTEVAPRVRQQHPLVQWLLATGRCDPGGGDPAGCAREGAPTVWLRRVAHVVRACYALLTNEFGATADGSSLGYAAVTTDYHQTHARRLPEVQAALRAPRLAGSAWSMATFTRVLVELATEWVGPHAQTTAAQAVEAALEEVRVRTRSVRRSEQRAGRRTRKRDLAAVLWHEAPDALAHLASVVAAALA